LCKGTPAAGGPCNDSNHCTDGNDCVLGETGEFAICESSTPTRGVPCDDYDEDTTYDVCQVEGSRMFCRGESVAASPGPSN
jgi:hypothetical protein